MSEIVIPDKRDGLQTPGFSWCRKCKTSWDKVSGHAVDVTPTRGHFALCELCWQESSIEERVEYYRDSFVASCQQMLAHGYGSLTEYQHELDELLENLRGGA